MTDIQQKALALVNEVRAPFSSRQIDNLDDAMIWEVVDALCHAIEQHEAFRQEVSDAVEQWKHVCRIAASPDFDRFIIAKPDPLVEAMGDALEAQGKGRPKHTTPELTKHLRAAIEKRGGKIVWGEG